MNKELKAFKDLLKQLFPNYNVDLSFDDICNCNANLYIIKTALINLEYNREKCLKMSHELNTKNEVLRIIKEKMVDMWNLKYTSTYKEYNRQLGMSAASLSQEEYDLLKEVLLR